MKTQGKVWVLYDTDTKSQSKPMSVVQAQVILLSLNKTSMLNILIWTPGWDKWKTVAEFLASDQTYFARVQPPTPHVPGSSTAEENTKTQSHTLTFTGTESPYTHVVMGEDPLKQEAVGGYYFQDFNGDELDLQKISQLSPPTGIKKTSATAKPSKPQQRPSERRAEPRHNFKIEVVLVSKVRSFRTYSKNISISGTMLEDEIPKDFLGQPFDLILVNPFDPDRSTAKLLFKAKIVGDLTDPRRLMFLEEDKEMTVRLNALLHAYVTYQEQMRRSNGT